MAFYSFNLARELGQIVKGERTDIPLEILAVSALSHLSELNPRPKRKPRIDSKNTELLFLRRLFAFEDSRS